jgi:hypothetical protein
MRLCCNLVSATRVKGVPTSNPAHSSSKWQIENGELTQVELKQSFKTAGAIGAAAAAGLLGSLAFASTAQAAEVVIPINDGNVPTTAADFEDVSCENLPDDLAADVDGWVFVLPASAGAEGNFISVTATYEDGIGNTYHLSTDTDGAIVEGSGDNKAYIIAPAGWTLVGAEALVNDPADGAFFNLTHACPGEPGENPSSPDEPTSPGSESPSEPGEESSSPECEEPTTAEEPTTGEETGSATASPSTPAGSETPCEEATSPAGNGNLPTTGTPLTIALVSAAALAAGGAVLYMIQRRRREAQDW